ncbi:DUF7333 family protein [Halalkalirubrum salinum]|uniref:DUF7333 family protein n=1 Tax=Halalkalirubrum salinum TaxID=2563889 RepID=UPI0010FB377C|nr:hypothetical protein [Halalkalirubrum salinum]
MEFNGVTTLVLYAVIIAIGVGGLAGSGVMTTDTVLMMVAPSMAIFGALMVGLGIKYGEHRATN